MGINVGFTSRKIIMNNWAIWFLSFTLYLQMTACNFTSSDSTQVNVAASAVTIFPSTPVIIPSLAQAIGTSGAIAGSASSTASQSSSKIVSTLTNLSPDTVLSYSNVTSTLQNFITDFTYLDKTSEPKSSISVRVKSSEPASLEASSAASLASSVFSFLSTVESDVTTSKDTTLVAIQTVNVSDRMQVITSTAVEVSSSKKTIFDDAISTRVLSTTFHNTSNLLTNVNDGGSILWPNITETSNVLSSASTDKPTTPYTKNNSSSTFANEPLTHADSIYSLPVTLALLMSSAKNINILSANATTTLPDIVNNASNSQSVALTNGVSNTTNALSAALTNNVTISTTVPLLYFATDNDFTLPLNHSNLIQSNINNITTTLQTNIINQVNTLQTIPYSINVLLLNTTVLPDNLTITLPNMTDTLTKTPPNMTDTLNITPPNVTDTLTITPPNVTDILTVTPPNLTDTLSPTNIAITLPATYTNNANILTSSSDNFFTMPNNISSILENTARVLLETSTIWPTVKHNLSENYSEKYDTSSSPALFINTLLMILTNDTSRRTSLATYNLSDATNSIIITNPVDVTNLTINPHATPINSTLINDISNSNITLYSTLKDVTNSTLFTTPFNIINSNDVINSTTNPGDTTANPNSLYTTPINTSMIVQTTGIKSNDVTNSIITIHTALVNIANYSQTKFIDASDTFSTSLITNTNRLDADNFTSSFSPSGTNTLPTTLNNATHVYETMFANDTNTLPTTLNYTLHVYETMFANDTNTLPTTLDNASNSTNIIDTTVEYDNTNPIIIDDKTVATNRSPLFPTILNTTNTLQMNFLNITIGLSAVNETNMFSMTTTNITSTTNQNTNTNTSPKNFFVNSTNRPNPLTTLKDITNIVSVSVSNDTIVFSTSNTTANTLPINLTAITSVPHTLPMSFSNTTNTFPATFNSSSDHNLLMNITHFNATNTVSTVSGNTFQNSLINGTGTYLTTQAENTLQFTVGNLNTVPANIPLTTNYFIDVRTLADTSLSDSVTSTSIATSTSTTTSISTTTPISTITSSSTTSISTIASSSATTSISTITSTSATTASSATTSTSAIANYSTVLSVTPVNGNSLPPTVNNDNKSLTITPATVGSIASSSVNLLTTILAASTVKTSPLLTAEQRSATVTKIDPTLTTQFSSLAVTVSKTSQDQTFSSVPSRETTLFTASLSSRNGYLNSIATSQLSISVSQQQTSSLSTMAVSAIPPPPNSTLAIVLGLVFGILFVVFIVGFTVCCCIRRKRSDNRQSNKSMTGQDVELSESNRDVRTANGNNKSEVPSNGSVSLEKEPGGSGIKELSDITDINEPSESRR